MLKHLVTRPGVLVPAVVGSDVHGGEFPYFPSVIDAILQPARLFLRTDFKPVLEEDRFTASPGDYPYTIDRIRVLGCSSSLDVFAVEIWQADADTPNPGPSLWTTFTAWQLNPGITFQDIILSTEPLPPPMITSGTVRVALINVLLGGFGFGVDSAITPHRNFVRTFPSLAWRYAENANVSGDWILRLGIVSDLIFRDGFQ